MGQPRARIGLQRSGSGQAQIRQPFAPQVLSETRRQLLEEVRLALTREPAAYGGATSGPDEIVDQIRGMTSVTVGSIVGRLNQLGFTLSDRLYEMRDELAAGRPIGQEDIVWLETVIAAETKASEPPNP